MKKRLIPFITVILLIFSIFSPLTFAEEEATKEPDPIPEVKAQHVVMLNLNTGADVYTKSPDEKAYPASLTKLITLLVASEHVTDYSQIVTIDKKLCWEDLVIGSSNIDLKDEEQLTIEDLMYAVAISSGNDAANALAIHLCGTKEAFVDEMNKKAKELGALNTNFVNTHGLHDENHYTTAHDMAIISRAAFENEQVLKYISASTHTIPVTNKTLKERDLVTTNKLMRAHESVYYKYCKAGKTGTTTAAGYNLISYAEKGDVSFLVVAMNAPKESGNANPIFSDSRSLYIWGFDNYTNTKILDDAEIVTEIKVKLSAKGDHLVLIPQKNLYAVIPNSWDISVLEKEITTKKNIKAPINQGDVLGTIELKKDGIVYGTANLVASTDVKRSTVLHILDKTETFFRNPYIIAICIIFAILIIIYIVVMISQNRKKRKKKLRNRIRF